MKKTTIKRAEYGVVAVIGLLLALGWLYFAYVGSAILSAVGLTTY